MPHLDDTRRLVIVLGLALVVRVALIATASGRPNDPDNYLPLARSLAEGRGFSFDDGRPTAYRPPLYPIVLAPLVALFGPTPTLALAVLHVGLGLGTVALAYLTARRWGLGPGRATVAAAVVALDPVAAVQARSVMTETLAAFLIASVLAGWTVPGRRGMLLGGIIGGLASLCRPSLLPGVGLAVGAYLIAGPGPTRRRAFDATVGLVALAVTMAPWAIRNARRLGEPVWTTTHGGYTLALANNPAYYADVVDGPPGAVWSGPNQSAWFDRITRETAGMTQPEADRHLRDDGLRMLRDRPGTFLRASAARLGRFWGVMPAAAVYPGWLRLAIAAWTVPLWLGLGAGLLRRDLWRWPAVAAPMALIGLTAVHALYWTDLRMRVPVVAAIALVASAAGPEGADRRGREKKDRVGNFAGQNRWNR